MAKGSRGWGPESASLKTPETGTDTGGRSEAAEPGRFTGGLLG